MMSNWGIVSDIESLMEDKLMWMLDGMTYRVMDILNISQNNDEVVGLIMDCVKDGGYDKLIDELVELEVVEIIEENK